MTVSLALRQQPGVSAATRARILAIARSIGYRSNPLVSAYQSYVRARRAKTYHANIAWINDHPDPKFWRWHPLQGYVTGAEQRADELGFKLEVFHLAAFGNTPAKARAGLQRILKNRGIHGVILPWLYSVEHTEADWSEFSVAMIGRNVGYGGNAREMLPLFHHVNPDNYYNTGLALDRLREMKLSRIGLALSKINDCLAGSLQRACYYVYQDQLPVEARIPVFIDRDLSNPEHRPDFIAWCDEHRIEAVLLYDDTLLEGPSRDRRRLLMAVQLNRTTQSGCGIDTKHAEISAACVDLVVGQLFRNERGRPATVKEVLVKGMWCAPRARQSRSAEPVARAPEPDDADGARRRPGR